MNLGIGLSVTTTYQSIPAVGLDPDAAIAALFETGTPGVYYEGAWYDPSDLSTLYQDAAGTTPVTGTGQPVGLMLDKSKGLTLGSELAPQDTSTTAGWVVSETAPASVTGTAQGLHLVSPSGEFAAVGVTVPAGGARFSVTYTVQLVSGRIEFRATPFEQFLAPGTYTRTVIVQAESAGTNIRWARLGASTDAYIRDVSIRELPGNHASQSTSSARPVLQIANGTPSSFGPELVTNGTFDTDTSGWTAAGGDISLASGWLRLTSTGSPCFASTPIATQIGKTYRITGQWRSDAGTWRIIVGQNAGSTSNYFASPAGSGSVDVTFVATVAATYVSLRSVTIAEGDSGEIDNISVQEVTAWTGGQYYLDFDGVDDCITSSSIDLTATNKKTLFAAVTREDPSNVVGVFAEFSANWNTNTGSSLLFSGVTTTGQGDGFGAASRGTATVTASQFSFTAAIFAPPVTAVLTATHDIPGDETVIRADGVSYPAGTADKGSGNFGNYPLYIFSRNGSSLQADGRLYGLILRGTASTTAEIEAAESYLATKSGVTL